MKKQLLLLTFLLLTYTAANTQIINLTSGGGGVMTGAPQSYNETRGIDVTLLASPVNVTSMTLHHFCSGGNTDSGFVGARIYNSVTQALLFSYDSVVAPMYDDSVKIPVSYLLNAGQSYRISFSCYGYGNNNSSGSAFLYQPTFPYTESGNFMQINSAHAGAVNTFPNNINIFVPYITLGYGTPLAADNFEKNDALNIFPNPVHSLATLKSNQMLNEATLTIYNMYGQTVKQLSKLSGYAITVKRDNLPAGIYFMRLTQDNINISTGKMIVAD